MKTALKGVNLGGWLVVEKWMTPSLFDGTDARNEFELSDSGKGRRRIARHHESFIREQDLEWLKNSGVELLRVPVGYWIFGDDKRYVRAIDRLDWLIDTSLSLGLKVLLDLHAAPGAQNRAEHSGSGNMTSDKRSTKWLNDVVAQDRTIEVLCKLAKRYKDRPNVWGIELLNEPSVDLLGLKLARFYRKAYVALIKVARPGTYIVFSDGYAPMRLTNCFWLMVDPEFPVAMDCHVYQVFGKRNARRRLRSHVRRMRLNKLFLKFLSWQQPLIIGEWSAMLPNKVPASTAQPYVEAQHRAYEVALAHMYWNYKTESDGRWNYRDQVEKGLLQ